MNETEFFVAESNRIEGIFRPPTDAEIEEHDRFISLDKVTIEEIERFVTVYQLGAQWSKRTRIVGMDDEKDLWWISARVLASFLLSVTFRQQMT